MENWKILNGELKNPQWKIESLNGKLNPSMEI